MSNHAPTPHHILVVEDSPGLSKVIQYNLKHAGYHVTAAANGLDAWELLQQHNDAQQPDLPQSAPLERFTLVLSDQQMPKLYGTDLRAKMLDMPELAAIPFVLLTAKGHELDCDNLQATLKISAILAKPFSPAMLTELVCDTLQVDTANSSV